MKNAFFFQTYVCRLPGGDPLRNPVLGVGGDPEAGEARDSACVCAESVRHHGEDAEVGRGREDCGQDCGGGGEAERTAGEAER